MTIKTESLHFLLPTSWLVVLRTFAPIATARFFAHVTHSSCIADHKGKQTFSRRMERKSVWHHGTAVDPGLLGNVTQLVTVWKDNRFENIAAILLSWMLGDPHFSFRGSLPFLILPILTKKQKNSEREKLQIFRLLCSRATEVFFLSCLLYTSDACRRS